MSFPRYPEYKDSGVEWLGEVPGHWEVTSLGRITVSRCDGPFGSGLKSEHYTETGVRVVRLQNIKAKGFNDSDAAFIDQEYHDNDLTGHEVVAGDMLIAGLGDDNNLVGRACVAPVGIEPAMVKADCFRFRLDQQRASSTFVAAVLSISAEYDSGMLATGTTRSRIPLTITSGRRIPLPPLPEQTAIAAFVARETAKIDALVAEQGRLMDLLKEKRQAVISHAVTKGINPDAPTKDTGIEWLGEVPVHWPVKPLKYLVTLTSGGTPSKENLTYWDGDVPWASSKDLKPSELWDTQDHITQKALDDGAAVLVPTGSILTVVRGMILLHTFPVVVARVPMAINQDLKAILPTTGVNADFLAWLLRGASAEVLSRTDEAAHGTKVLRLESWLAMQVPVPPVTEQADIVAGIIRRLGELDTLTAEAQRAIALLQERRTALISAAVTGQIDVRLH